MILYGLYLPTNQRAGVELSCVAVTDVTLLSRGHFRIETSGRFIIPKLSQSFPWLEPWRLDIATASPALSHSALALPFRFAKRTKHLPGGGWKTADRAFRKTNAYVSKGCRAAVLRRRCGTANRRLHHRAGVILKSRMYPRSRIVVSRMQPIPQR
jgi:hypothetical protein